MANRKRLDDLLIEQGMARNRADAFVVVTGGRVRVNGQKAVSPAQPVAGDARIVVEPLRKFVGRGGYKLEAAISAFGLSIRGLVAADVGSATGGFVDVLLREGAAKVYAIDTARGKLDPKIRNDSRVVVMEETNALALAALPEPADLITMDVSLVSLRALLPRARAWLRRGGSVVALFKPQYEADAADLRHGVVRDDETRERTLRDFRGWLRGHDWRETGMIASPIRGSAGNIEYLFLLAPRQ